MSVPLISLQWEVYSNMAQLIKYRRATTNHKFLDQETFLRMLGHSGYIVIECSRDRRALYIVIIAPGSTISSKSADFKKMMDKLDFRANETNNEVLVISETPLSNFIKKTFPVYKKQYPNLYYEDHIYRKFVVVAPEHPAVPKHEVMTADEITELCQRYHTTRDKFPRLLHTDTMAVWLGVRPGDMVRIYRVCPNMGEQIVYRVCARDLLVKKAEKK